MGATGSWRWQGGYGTWMAGRSERQAARHRFEAGVLHVEHDSEARVRHEGEGEHRRARRRGEAREQHVALTATSNRWCCRSSGSSSSGSGRPGGRCC
jgi:hypothetical protein